MTVRPMPARLLAAPLALLVSVAAASAQVATLSVTVVGPDGAAASFVDVRLDGGTTHLAENTATEGVVTFRGLEPGTYEVAAATDGAASDLVEIDLGPGERRSVRLVLRDLEEYTEIHEVDALASELVQSEESSVQTTYGGDELRALPLGGSSVADLASVAPGVLKTGDSESQEISIGGGTTAQIGFSIDGASNNDPTDGGVARQVSAHAIESLTVKTAGGSARTGEHATGEIQVVTRSGSNEQDFTYALQVRDSAWGSQGLAGADAVGRAVDDLLRAAGSILEPELRAGFRLLGVDPISTLADDRDPVARRRVRHTVSAGGPIRRDVAFFHSTLESVQDDFGSPFVDGSVQDDAILWTGKATWHLAPGGGATNRLELTGTLDSRDTGGFADLRSTRSTNTVGTRTSWAIGVADTHAKGRTVVESRLTLSHEYETARPEDTSVGVGPSFEVLLPPGGPTSYVTGAADVSSDQSQTTLRGDVNVTRVLGRRGQHVTELGATIDHVAVETFTQRGPRVTDLRVVDDTNVLGSPAKLAGRVVSHGPPLRTDDASSYVGVYVTDAWSVTDSFVLHVGLRAEYQSFIGRVFLAPRVGFSLDPVGDGKGRFFANWGIFHDRLFGNFVEYTQRPERHWSQIRFTEGFAGNERRFSRVSIEDAWKDAITRSTDSDSPGTIAFLVPEVVDRFVGSADVTAPTNKDWLVGFTRELPGPLRLEVAYRENERTHQVEAVPVVRREATLGQPQVRDIVYGTSGEGRFRQWSAEIVCPRVKRWSLSLSYVRSRNVGPVGPPLDPIDPADVLWVDALLPVDRTHAVKLHGTARLGRLVKAPRESGQGGGGGWDAAVELTWQSGLPITASLYRDTGVRAEPIGRNSLRLPSTRMLNLGLSRSFVLSTSRDGDGGLPVRVGVKAQVLNALNDANVVGALARFRTDGGSNPQSFPPLRPDLIATDLDVPRSLEVGFSVSF